MNKIQSELEKIQIPDEVMDRMYKGMERAKREEKAGRFSSKRKKLIGSLTGLVAAFGLLFGATFVSPAMAEMAAKIPYLNEVFLKDINEDGAKSVFALVREEGLRRGYEPSGFRVGQGLMEGDDPDKIYIFLKSNDYNEKTKLDAEKLTKEMLDQKGYYAKSIEVLPFKADFYASMRRINRIMIEEAKKIETLIKEKGYSVDYVGMNRGLDEIFVILPDTEKHVDEVRTIIQAYQKGKYNEFYLDIRTVDLTNLDQETKLKKDLYTIFEGLVAKQEAYKVNSFTYSTTDQLVITIETSLEKKDQKLEEQIRKEVSAQLDKEYKQPYTINMVGLEELKAIGE
ncbi:hypothetical protein [Bacillus salipaludis]|uniref:DUF4030 domain-containing protein n=1 Tax=Bacillus salipaludis TaxID=2547811 RepID=A0ABW8RLS6_9BACI